MCYKIFNIAIVAIYFSEFSFRVNSNQFREFLLIIDYLALTKLKLVVKWQNLLALMGTASFPAPIFGQERYSGQQDKAPKKYYKKIWYYSNLYIYKSIENQPIKSCFY